jgi:hypothetical protein
VTYLISHFEYFGELIMKKFVKFLFAGIVLVKTNFAMDEKPLVPMSAPKSFSALLELEAGLLASNIVIEGKDEIKTKDPLPIEIPKILLDRKALMERRARFYKEVIFSRGQDCFYLDSINGTQRIVYKKIGPKSNFSESLLNGFTDFETPVELTYFLKLLHNMVLRDSSRVGMIKTILESLEHQLRLAEK